MLDTEESVSSYFSLLVALMQLYCVYHMTESRADHKEDTSNIAHENDST